MNVSLGYRKNGFDAYGGRVLKQSDMAYWVNSPHLTDPRGVAFELDEDVEEVESGFFEMLPTLSEIWIINPECRIYPTAAEEKLLKDNNVLIRGEYGTSAEKFARRYRLRFLHLDVVLASVGDYYQRGIDIITLRFREGGSAYIHQDCRCQGSSAGSVGGGEISFDLPDDFYLTMSAKDIAGQCWGSCYSEILSKGKLAAFLKRAKQKQGYYLDFT